MPVDDICDLNPELFAFNSGPDNGISDVSLVSFRKQQLVKDQQKIDDTAQLKTTNLILETVKQEPNSNETEKLRQTEVISINPSQTEKEKVLAERNFYTECCDSFIKSGTHHSLMYF